MNFSNDTTISQLNDVNYEVEMEERKKKRRPKINTPEALFALWEKGEGEEGDIILHEESLIADICEVMVGERSSGGLIRALKEEKRESVATLLEILINGGMEPVKISDWAEEADIDEYYLHSYAEEACEMLPPGIVEMKEGNFVMGDALTLYIKLHKTIYAHEVKAMLDEDVKKAEKEIATNLGVSSLEGFLKMKTIKDVFFVENKNGEVYVSIRA